MRCLIILIITLCLIVGSAAAGPMVKIVNDTHNFGQVAEGPYINHSFWIKSVGDEPLRVLSIYPGCSCTQIPLRDSVLNPGESTAVEIILRTRRLTGNVEKRPEFTTNASDKPFILKMFANVLLDPETMKPLLVHPAKVDVSQFGDKPRRRAKFYIVNPTDQPLQMTIVDTLDKSFTIEMPKEVKAKDSVEVTVTVKKDRLESSFGESFTFEVVSDGYPRITVPIGRIFKGKETGAVTPAVTKKP